MTANFKCHVNQWYEPLAFATFSSIDSGPLAKPGQNQCNLQLLFKATTVFYAAAARENGEGDMDTMNAQEIERSREMVTRGEDKP